jgi:hypothetical protein
MATQEFDSRLDTELHVRYRRRPRDKREGKQFDLDNHSYSKTVALIAIIVGVFTIVLQIFVVVAFALYVQYRYHRDWYVNYAQTLSNPEHYQQIFDNATRAADQLLPGD